MKSNDDLIDYLTCSKTKKYVKCRRIVKMLPNDRSGYKTHVHISVNIYNSDQHAFPNTAIFINRFIV